MATVALKNGGWQRLYVFFISYILHGGLSPQNASHGPNTLECSFYAGKIASTPQIFSVLPKAKTKTTEISVLMKLTKLSKLV